MSYCFFLHYLLWSHGTSLAKHSLCDHSLQNDLNIVVNKVHLQLFHGNLRRPDCVSLIQVHPSPAWKSLMCF